MGTWGAAIKSNDTASDIYADFYDLYNEGKEPAEIAKTLIGSNKELIDSPDDSNNFWFALSLALWETKSLDQETFIRVKDLVESGKDLESWRALDADEGEIRKRKSVLENFLLKISKEKDKPKARKKKRTKEPVFEKGVCLTFRLPNGNFGGAVVLEADSATGIGYNLIVVTRINQPTKPTKEEFEKAKVLVASFGNWENQPKLTWYLPDRYQKEYSELFELAGKIQVDKNYTPNGKEVGASFSAGWHHIITAVTAQMEYEKLNGETKSFPLTDLTVTEKKKWWRF